MKKNLLIMCLMAFSSFAIAQTGTIKGRILDPETNESLIGANAVISGTTQGATTDIDGYFTISNVEAGNVTVNISFIGYSSINKSVTVNAGQTTDIGDITLNSNTIGLSEVEVIASVAIDRKTPVAVSTIKGEYIEEKLGSQEFPEILKGTPGVYVTKAGGGFGDARIRIRGFDSENVAVMINGVPVNDMENGRVYWSNWAGLM
ncbi:MAG: TonB-dependent receptor [Cyclobacteriaceae bacterium]|nr:TonB-dependent receptor [Cyclobacteriaceae bacterium]